MNKETIINIVCEEVDRLRRFIEEGGSEGVYNFLEVWEENLVLQLIK